MNDKDKKELVVIPEPNQESITKTFNDIIIILKSVLLASLIMITFTLIIGVFRSI